MANCILLFLVNSILKQKIFVSQFCEIIMDFDRLHDVDWLRIILVSTNEDIIVSLGKFIYDGFKSRDQIYINASWDIFISMACFVLTL